MQGTVTTSEPEVAGRRRRRIWPGVIGAFGALTALALAAAGMIGLGGRRSDPPAAGPTLATASVTRTTLVETKTVKGTLGYADPVTLASRLPGTLTWLPAVGKVLRRGDPAFRVDNQPIVVLIGVLPAYRSMAVKTVGPDVAQLERNLAALGYPGFTVDDTFSAATEIAVKAWQKKLGVAETGRVDPAQILVVPGKIRVAARKARPGDTAGPGTVLLVVTGTKRIVSLQVDAADQRLVGRGTRVTLRLPKGATATGKVQAAATTIADDNAGAGDGQGDGDDASGKLAVTVTVADQRAVVAYDQGPVDVILSVGKRPKVLTVPVVALLALAGGGYGVEVVTGTTSTVVPVKAGMFAAGRVEISGSGITEGTLVAVPSA